MIKKYVNILYEKVPYWSVWFYLVCMTLLFVAGSVYLSTLNGDNIEHVHSSFLVAIGQVPYRDFFQHHNPLLWYLFAPLAKLFAYDTTITEITCFISFLVFLKSLIYVYRICNEFLTTSFWALVGVALVAMPGYRFYALDFRPDNFMMCCLFGGIYYYFLYLRDKKTISLVGSFVLFFIAFMFAQKALFSLFILGLTGLYFWYKKDILTKDLLKALVLPITGLLGFLGYLYYYDMVALYFQSNYVFNLELANSFEQNTIAEMPFHIALFVVLAWFGVIYSLKLKNKYLFVLSFLFVAEFFQRRFYFSPFSYYYFLLVYLSAFCIVPMLEKINLRFAFLKLFVVVCLYVGMYKVIFFHIGYWKTMLGQPYLPDYVTRNISPCDYVFNGDGIMYNLFGKDPSYYWQLIGQLDVIGERVGIREKPNVGKLILELKPKFVYGKNYYNKFAKEKKKNEILHYVDKDVLNKYYVKTDFSSIYELKKEYDNRLCIWDNQAQIWKYQ